MSNLSEVILLRKLANDVFRSRRNYTDGKLGRKQRGNYPKNGEIYQETD
jgi:hypothetical protein